MLIINTLKSQKFVFFHKKIAFRKKKANFYLVNEKKVLPLCRF